MPGLSIADLLCLTTGLRNTWDLTIWLILHRWQSSEASSEEQANRMDVVELADEKVVSRTLTGCSTM